MAWHSLWFEEREDQAELLSCVNCEVLRPREIKWPARNVKLICYPSWPKIRDHLICRAAGDPCSPNAFLQSLFMLGDPCWYLLIFSNKLCRWPREVSHPGLKWGWISTNQSWTLDAISWWPLFCLATPLSVNRIILLLSNMSTVENGEGF